MRFSKHLTTLAPYTTPLHAQDILLLVLSQHTLQTAGQAAQLLGSKSGGRRQTCTIVLQDALPATIWRKLGIVGEVSNAQRSTIVRPVWDIGCECQDGIQRRCSHIVLAKIPGTRRWSSSLQRGFGCTLYWVKGRARHGKRRAYFPQT